MKRGIGFSKKGIGFSGVIALIVVAFIIQDVTQAEIHLDYQAILITIIYFIIALPSEDYSGVEDVFNTIWKYNKDTEEANMKLQLIKSFLQIKVVQWHKYFIMYEQIVNETKITFKMKIKDMFSRIINGKVSFKQFCWIMAYVIYNLFKDSFFGFISNDVDFIVGLLGIGFFMFTSGEVLHMDEFMSDVFTVIKPTSKQDVEFTLSLLESNIIFGARQYGFLTEIKKELEAKNITIDEKQLKKDMKKVKEEKEEKK